jgi:hypothetical protein
MNEELRDVLPHLIVNTAYTQMCKLGEQSKSPVFYIQVLISIQQQTRESSLFKNFAKLIEGGFTYLAQYTSKLDPEIAQRAREVTAYYISQLTLGETTHNQIYARLEEAGVSESYIRSLVLQVVRMSFFKRVKENTDERFHRYFPESLESVDQLHFNYLDQPTAVLITDKLQSKEPPHVVRQFLMESSEVQASGQELKAIFLECVFSRARKSLEHVKKSVEVFYNQIFEPWFINASDARQS